MYYTMCTCSENFPEKFSMNFILQNFTDDDGKRLARCIMRTDNILSKWRTSCGEEYIFAPVNLFDMIVDEELTQAGVVAGSGGSGGSGIGIAGSESEEAVVQIKPQRVSMKLRVRKCSFTFRLLTLFSVF